MYILKANNQDASNESKVMHLLPRTLLSTKYMLTAMMYTSEWEGKRVSIELEHFEQDMPVGSEAHFIPSHSTHAYADMMYRFLNKKFYHLKVSTPLETEYNGFLFTVPEDIVDDETRLQLTLNGTINLPDDHSFFCGDNPSWKASPEDCEFIDCGELTLSMIRNYYTFFKTCHGARLKHI